MKSVQKRIFSGPYFPVFGFRKSPYSVQIQENTDQKKLRIWTLFMQCVSNPKISACVHFRMKGINLSNMQTLITQSTEKEKSYLNDLETSIRTETRFSDLTTRLSDPKSLNQYLNNI